METPQDNGIEKAVLSTLFNTDYIEGGEQLDADCFNHPFNHRMFKHIMAETRPLDVVSFTSMMLNSGTLDEVGGPGVISEIFTYSPTSAHFKRQVKTLIDLKARRMAIKAAHNIIESAQNLNESTYLEKCGEPVMSVFECSTATTKARTKKEILSSVVERYQQRLKGGEMGYKTSLPILNKALNGFETPRYIVISGRPGSGKTLLAGQILCDIALTGIPCLMLSCEMPADQIAGRFVIQNAGLEPDELNDPIKHARENGRETACRVQQKRIARSIKAINECPLEFEEPTAPKLGQIMTMIRRHVMKNGTRVVALDYIQLCNGSKGLNKEQEMTEISHALQGIAKELNVCIIVLSQENANGDTKYAATVTEDADAVLSIIQNLDKTSDDYKKVLGVLVNKVRHNGNGGMTLPIEPHPTQLRFIEVDHSKQY